MDKREIYMPLFQGRGVPIRCCSKGEVQQLMEDLRAIFPDHIDIIDARESAFGGSKQYRSEIVYRIHDDNIDELTFDFCTKDFYLMNGYTVVDFVDLFQSDLGEIDVGAVDLSALIFADN